MRRRKLRIENCARPAVLSPLEIFQRLYPGSSVIKLPFLVMHPSFAILRPDVRAVAFARGRGAFRRLWENTSRSRRSLPENALQTRPGLAASSVPLAAHRLL